MIFRFCLPRLFSFCFVAQLCFFDIGGYVPVLCLSCSFFIFMIIPVVDRIGPDRREIERGRGKENPRKKSYAITILFSPHSKQIIERNG